MTERESQITTWGLFAGFAIGMATSGQFLIAIVSVVVSIVALVRWYRLRMRSDKHD